MATVLEAKNIVKEFPGVRALDNVSFSLEEKQIHALCGENGAGKSTLINVLSGVYPASSFEGSIILDNESVEFRNTKEADQHGIAVVHQELNLFSELSVAENMFMGNEIHNHGIVGWDEIFKQTDMWLKKLKIEGVDASTKIKELGVGKQQLVEIARVLRLADVKVLILDEPTASLTDAETDILMGFLKELKNHGTSCIYISHKLDEVLRIADYVTVLRDGKTVGGDNISAVTKDDIISMMVGREIEDMYPDRQHVAKDESILRVVNFNVRERFTHKVLVEDANFELKRGEILGMYGLIGAGRTELVNSMFGSTEWQSSGEVHLDNSKIKSHSTAESLKKGMALLTEDRKSSGIVPTMSVRENTSLTFLEMFKSLMGIRVEKEVIQVKEVTESLNVKTPSINTKIVNLSGGNQQKVLIARCLLSKIKVLIMDEPTRGIDVGAKQEIYSIIERLVEEGVSVIMVSSELPEILGMCDRILVMNKGKITGEFDSRNEKLTQADILKSATGTES